MKPFNRPSRVASVVRKWLQDPLGAEKTQRHHNQNQNCLQHGKHQLKIAGLLDAEIIQPGNQPGDRDGEYLRPEEREGQARNGIRQVRKDGKELERARQAQSDGRDRSRLGHRKPGPHVEETRRVPVGAAQVDIFAARIRHHGAQFRVSHGSKKREQSTHDPRQVDQQRGASVAHHLAGNEKNAAADNGPDHDRNGFARAEDARQAGGRTIAGTTLRSAQKFLHL